jgi:hypothetical protein
MARDDRLNRRGDSGPRTVRSATPRRSAFDEALLQRVYCELLEMPGLQLTCQQAQRLLGFDESTCVQLLEWFVDAKFLCRPGHGTNPRLTGGYTPRPRMAETVPSRG